VGYDGRQRPGELGTAIGVNDEGRDRSALNERHNEGLSIDSQCWFRHAGKVKSAGVDLMQLLHVYAV
jgi:hypothetical protein